MGELSDILIIKGHIVAHGYPLCLFIIIILLQYIGAVKSENSCLVNCMFLKEIGVSSVMGLKEQFSILGHGNVTVNHHKT